ncbi:MAG: endonuclease [Sulfurimonadaceae bacterium]|nr:endonuclease [Sulfurimonadaceae bacterium]
MSRKQEQQKFQAWNKRYPADKWEIERNKRIKKFQGNYNLFISKTE